MYKTELQDMYQQLVVLFASEYTYVARVDIRNIGFTLGYPKEKADLLQLRKGTGKDIFIPPQVILSHY